MRPGYSVLGWEFSWNANPTGPLMVTSSSTDTTWSGVAVSPGVVSATVVKGGDTLTFSGDLEVTDRTDGWSWGPELWEDPIEDVTPAMCDTLFSDLIQPFDSVLVGLNHPLDQCTSRSIDPSVITKPDSGFTALMVADGGPNDSLWYVTEASYFMEAHETELNPFIRPGGPTVTSTSLDDYRKCKKALNLGNQQVPVVVNFYDYNKLCRREPVDDMITNALAHEAFGTHWKQWT